MIDTRELVERARRGDTQAFETLVRGHYRAAYAAALARTGNAMDAEDVVQDGFIRALEHLDQCDPDRFSAWLLTIVRNRAHNVRDRERIRDAAPLDAIPLEGPSRTDAATEQGELGRLLEEAMTDLSPIQREVLLLHDLEGWKHKEIAETLDLSEVMARQHLFQARKRIREHLAGAGLNDRLKEYLHD